MPCAVAVRRETHNTWERRAPITPAVARRLITRSGLEILVQPSARRVFPDKEYVRAGAVMASDLSEARIVLGVKPPPLASIGDGSVHLAFAHVVKGQPENTPLLRRLIAGGCTLIDYEMLRDESGRRLAAFGYFAGVAGMVDTLWALGRRLDWEGARTPLLDLDPAHVYGEVDAARAAVRQVARRIRADGLATGLSPLLIGIVGYGNVANGARDILRDLDALVVDPAELALVGPDSHRGVVASVFEERHTVRHRLRPAAEFDLEEYTSHPDRYESAFSPSLGRLHVLVNCTYWDERFPRLVLKRDVRALYRDQKVPRLRIIGDLGCDVGGAVECTLRATDPGDPVYVWDPVADAARSGVAGDGPVILAVDNLPAELPREASEEFANAIAPFLPALAGADLEARYEQLALPPELLGATVVHRGELTPPFAYLARHLGS